MIEYPAFFPCPTWEYQEATDASRDRAPFQCGWTRQRSRYTQFRRDINISFLMDTVMFATWSTWVRANAHQYFLIEIDGENVAMRFTGAVEAAYSNFDVMQARAPGELQDG